MEHCKPIAAWLTGKSDDGLQSYVPRKNTIFQSIVLLHTLGAAYLEASPCRLDPEVPFDPRIENRLPRIMLTLFALSFVYITKVNSQADGAVGGKVVPCATKRNGMLGNRSLHCKYAARTGLFLWRFSPTTVTASLKGQLQQYHICTPYVVFHKCITDRICGDMLAVSRLNKNIARFG